MSPALLGAALALVGTLALVGAVRCVRATPVPAPAGRDPYAPPPKPPIGRLGLRVALAVAGGLAVAVATRWPVGAVVAAAGGFLAPSLGRSRTGRRVALERMEAVAAWAEMLRDVLAAGSGLEQAILVTANVAPKAIEPELARLADRVGRGEDLVDALLHFVGELDDPMADKVVAALVLAARRSPGHLGDLLGALAEVARDNVAMRLKVQAGRARIRTSMRLITGLTVGFSLLVVVADRDYVASYRSLAGQLVLAAVVALFAGAHLWVERATGERRGERVLGGVDPSAAAAMVEESSRWRATV
ncbi:MAG TPA: type II secretion system F family protein [Acidimicrobiales bacterium]|nr:type II secretion system F family protein [Acidimicrobiales bacterium]